MLAVCSALDVLVVGGRAECAVDGQRLPEMVTDLLQQLYKIHVHKHRVTAILTPELLHAEVLAQRFAPVLRIGICFDCHCSAHFFLF